MWIWYVTNEIKICLHIWYVYSLSGYGPVAFFVLQSVWFLILCTKTDLDMCHIVGILDPYHKSYERKSHNPAANVEWIETVTLKPLSIYSKAP